MKSFLFILISFLSVTVYSQDLTNINAIKADETYENICIKKLDSDSNSTSFVIWIKKGVKSHKHVEHSELIYVIAGEGVMTINNKSFDIKPGDYFRIPQNTFHSLRVLSNDPVKVLSVQAPEFYGKDRVFEEIAPGNSAKKEKKSSY